MESSNQSVSNKVSDSGYSNSCSNSNSQRSASSKSRLSRSNSSSGSSGYGGNCSKNNSSSTSSSNKHVKEKEHKKKKLKNTTIQEKNSVNEAVETNISTKINTRIIQVPPSFEAETLDNEEGLNLLQNLEEEKGNPNISVLIVSPTKERTVVENIQDWKNTTFSNEPIEQADNANIKNTCSDDSLDSFKKSNCNNLEEGFCCVVSMYDGVVLYTTPSLTNLLGFPKDMWLGRSFIDFVHPKDKETFSSQVTTGITVPLTDSSGKSVKNSFYVFLRKYKSLKTTGFGVVEKTVSYQAFQLTATFRHIKDSQETKHSSCIGGIFLIIVAVPVTSSFKEPHEKKVLPKFNMHHSAASTVTYVDADIVKIFGFMPQDILGRSVFDFYHPEDMPLLKEVYESTLSQCQIAGTVHKSKPYRFAVQNGGFATIETDWSCFFNPWSRKLEIVIGLHNILKGPKNPDVFDSTVEKEIKNISEATLKKSDLLREEILRILNYERTKLSEQARKEVKNRRKDLTKFIEKVMTEVGKPNVKSFSPECSIAGVLDREVMVLGEVSPHNDYSDRASSETPPSYYQLNYNENIHRFFESKPRTKGSDGGGQPSTGPDSEQEGKNTTAQEDSMGSIGKSYSPQNNGESRSGSENLSSASNVNYASGPSCSSDSYNTPHLTEALLLKHDKDMEKIMRNRYREYRSAIKDKDGKTHKLNKKLQMQANLFQKNDRNHDIYQPHGVKRSVSRSWEEEHHKIIKHKHQANMNNYSNGRNPQEGQRDDNYYKSQTNDTNLWPPFSLTVTPTTDSYAFTVNHGTKTNNDFAGLFPVYLLPTPNYKLPTSQNVPPSFQNSPVQVQYMPNVMYNCQSVYSPSPIFYPPMAFMPVPFQQSLQQTSTKDFNSDPRVEKSKTLGGGAPTVNSSLFARQSSSQVTSNKAEPGSGLGSMTSNSCLNKAVNSKMSGTSSDMQESFGTCDVSSQSSITSSFLKTTDPGSDPNDNSSASDNRNSSNNGFYKKPVVHPVRNRDPPWMETVSVTPDLIYRYQVTSKTMDEILKADKKSLKEIHQPSLVNEQLEQLYSEMESEGLSARLTLEEGVTTSSGSSSSEDATGSDTNQRKIKKKRKKHSSSLVMIYEENAPLPSPETCGET